MGTSYVLHGQETDLQKHVGHKIEVTGSIDSAMAGGSGSGGSTAAGGSTAGGSTAAGSTSGSTATGSTAAGSTSGGSTMAGGSMSGGQHLRVASVRMISADCSSK